MWREEEGEEKRGGPDVKNDTAAPEISAKIVAGNANASIYNLRRHVARGADDALKPLDFADGVQRCLCVFGDRCAGRCPGRESKVGQHHLPCTLLGGAISYFTQQDVFRFQVAMHNASLVQIGHRVQDLLEEHSDERFR